MSTFFFYSKNIPVSTLERYCPPEAIAIRENRITIERLDQKSARISLAADDMTGAHTQLIPALSIASRQSWGYRCFLQTGDNQSGVVQKYGLSRVGDCPSINSGICFESEEVRAGIDSIFINTAPRAPRIFFRVVADDIAALLKQPLLISLSVTPDPLESPELSAVFSSQHDIGVPAKSQMIHDEKIRHRICSPACLAMVLEYFGRDADTLSLARRAYHSEHDLYGVWPNNLWAVSKYGCLGYIHRFSRFDEAAKLLDLNIPLICSIQYQTGQLANAAIDKTEGHLVVVRGYGPDGLIVNDPAAAAPEKVKRTYPVDEFLGAWLGGKAVAYVLMPADGS